MGTLSPFLPEENRDTNPSPFTNKASQNWTGTFFLWKRTDTFFLYVSIQNKYISKVPGERTGGGGGVHFFQFFEGYCTVQGGVYCTHPWRGAGGGAGCSGLKTYRTNEQSNSYPLEGAFEVIDNHSESETHKMVLSGNFICSHSFQNPFPSSRKSLLVGTGCRESR